MDNSSLLLILSALLAVSEALALIPSLKSSGILDFIMNVLKSVLGNKE